MTDCDYVLAELRRGPRCAIDIISSSIRERGTGLTVHSRVAELRGRGYEITCVVDGKTRAGRDRYLYRLVSEPEVSPSIVEQLPPKVSAGCPVLGGEQFGVEVGLLCMVVLVVGVILAEVER